MDGDNKRNNPENNPTEPVTNPEGLSRRDFFSKAAAAGAGTYLAAKGTERAYAQLIKPGLVQGQFPPVSPTLKLSVKALQTPFNPALKWLPEVRVKLFTPDRLRRAVLRVAGGHGSPARTGPGR